MAKFAITIKLTATEDGQIGAKFSKMKIPNINDPEKMTAPERVLAEIAGSIIDKIDKLGERQNENAGASSD